MRRKQSGLTAFELAVTLAIIAVMASVTMPPYLKWWRKAQLSGAVSNLAADLEMAKTQAIRENATVVVEFENRWGAINEFPQQNVAAAMFRLQEVLAGEQLSSLELSEGLIRIQGTSSDPQAILQRLEQDPLFTEVVFSRATSNTRYYIDLRLATVNFEAYRVRHFPDET